MTLPNPHLSIVLGSRNRLDALKRCIASIRDNGLDAPHEVIVIDAGSTDGSVQWLCAQTDLVSIVQHNIARHNADPATGRRLRTWGYFMNMAFRAAHAPIICMLSDDCEVLPGALRLGLDIITAAPPDVACAAMPFRNVPLETTHAARRTIHDVLFVNHGFFRADVFARLGGFEEELYEFYKADSDYGLRLVEHGYRTIVAEGALVDHHLTQDECRAANAANAQMDRDRVPYLRRWEGRPPDPANPRTPRRDA